MYKNKSFDCVEMKRNIQNQLHQELKPTSIDDYYQKLSEHAKKSKQWKALQAKSINRQFLS